jgi:hypothetical protein
METTQKFTGYHFNILNDPKDNDHHMVRKALEYIDVFEDAIVNVINDGDWEKYINSILEYDKFLWECHHLHPQKTNPINIIQNKKYSSYRETLLYPLWIRVSKQLNFETIQLINKSVPQTIFEDGSTNYKDVDGGIGIICEFNNEKIILPIVTNEDKSGHFCKTQASNVNGINRKFKQLNSNIITICTTDNQVTIGKNVDGNLLYETNMLVPLRNNNLNHKIYNSLNHNVLRDVEKILVNKLNDMGSESFSCGTYKITSKTNKLIREFIDSQEIYLNF